jgi:hypothetical protein
MVVCPDPEDVCSGGACVPADQDGDGDGFVARNDCDDGDPTTHPGAVERCNGVDDDCDRATPDGGDEPWLGEVCDGEDDDLCTEGTFQCIGGAQACSDTTAASVEVCNGVDDDCDRATPDGAGEPWLDDECDGEDDDRCTEGTFQCIGGVQACSDATTSTVEVCNGLDDDCDGDVDEGTSCALPSCRITFDRSAPCRGDTVTATVTSSGSECSLECTGLPPRIVPCSSAHPLSATGARLSCQLTATGTGGTSRCSEDVDVGSPPMTCTGAFDPASVCAGQESTVTWTTDGETCDFTCDGSPWAEIDCFGTSSVLPGTESIRCEIRASNECGTRSCSATLTVSNPPVPTCSGYFDPPAVPVGSWSRGCWSASGAEWCEYECSNAPGVRVAVDCIGCLDAGPLGSSLTCTLYAHGPCDRVGECSATVEAQAL